MHQWMIRSLIELAALLSAIVKKSGFIILELKIHGYRVEQAKRMQEQGQSTIVSVSLSAKIMYN